LLAQGQGATKAYQSALETLEMVQLFQESSGESGESFAGRVLMNFCYLNLLQIAKIRRPKMPEPTTAADCYFWGIGNLWISVMPENDPTSVALQKGSFLVGVDVSGASARAEQSLRRAATLEPSHYWVHLWLGWSNLNPALIQKGADKPADVSLDNLRKAELAFNTCVAVRPDFPSGYYWRANVILRQMNQTMDARVKEELRQRAILNLQLAAKYGADDPWIQVMLVEAWYHLGDRPKLLETCGRALELQAPLEFWRGRRNQEDVRQTALRLGQYAHWLKQTEPDNADALAVAAHARWFVQEDCQASCDAEDALNLRASHPRALVVRGMVRLRDGDAGGAADDFQKALAGEPKHFLAAAGRARVLEIQDRRDEALAAYAHLQTLAATYWQEIEALLGQARLLEKLGCPDAAAAALAKARRIKPSITDARASYLFSPGL
jgi:tetratricopeptide (TPR) repeat protein